MSLDSQLLRVIPAGELDDQAPEEQWLIQSLWSRRAVGFLAGPPKNYKSFLGIDMAVSVASGTSCLGHFPVHHPGPALVYLAEDDPPTVRFRIESLCRHRDLDIHRLPLHVITEPCLRLDQERDQQRLQRTVESLRPHLVLLDPLIRLHRLEENSASEISRLLSYFRELQRRSDCAVAIVHHVSKRQRAQAGQSLRGSSDLHAFADSSAYLFRRRERLILTIEHRSAPPPPAMVLQLASGPQKADIHLELNELTEAAQYAGTLAESVLSLLHKQEGPLPGKEIRGILRVNNQKLWRALKCLEDQGAIEQTSSGWQVRPAETEIEQQLLFG